MALSDANVASAAPKPAASGSSALSAPSSNGRGRNRPLYIVLLLLALGAGVVGCRYWQDRLYETTDDAFVEGDVTEMSPQVPATVLRVHVHENQLVHAGDLLVELDPRDYEVRLAEARAALVTAEARLTEAHAQQSVAQAEAGQADADREAARATAENAAADLKRSQALDSKDVISRREYDNAVASSRTSLAAVQSAEKRVLATRSLVEAADARAQLAQAGVEEARVKVRDAELQLSYTKISAPSNGRITRKSVQPGSYVQVGQTLFSIVSDNVWIVANFKETQMKEMRPGQPVEIRVDALGEAKMKGHVESIQAGTGARFSTLPPENATGNYVKIVQRVPVKIFFDEPAEKIAGLAPGFSVVPRVLVR